MSAPKDPQPQDTHDDAASDAEGNRQLIVAQGGATIKNVIQAAFHFVLSPWGAAVLALGLVLAATIPNLPSLLSLLPTPPAFEPAREDETLIVVAAFAGRLSDLEVYPERYIRDALRERVERLNLTGQTARLEMWTTPVATQHEARALGESYRATLVVWGEFDDVGGVRTFVEIMRDVPQPDVQQSGDRLPLATLPSEQSRVGDVSRECLLDGLPRQADYLATLSLGLIRLIRFEREQAEFYFTQAIESAQPGAPPARAARRGPRA